MKFEQVRTLKEFNRLYREIEMFYHESARKADMSDSAFIILYTILELGEGCLQKDICEMNSISKQTINSSIQKMVREGIIEIRRENSRDKKIYLTQEGKQYTKEKVLPFAEMENEVFAEMTEEESRELLRLTEKYLEQFRAKAGGL